MLCCLCENTLASAGNISPGGRDRSSARHEHHTVGDMSRVIPARARYDLLRNGSFAAHEKGTKCIYPRVFCRGM